MATDMNPYRPAPGSLPPVLAGRDGELSATASAIALTQQSGAAQPIFYTGLRGMGKTALLRQAAKQAERRGAIVLYAEAGEDTALTEAFRRSLDRAARELRDIPARLRSALQHALEALPVPVYQLPNDGGTVALAKQPLRNDDALPQTFERLNREAWDSDHFLVVCIDEVQDAPPEQLRPLVTLVHETAGTNHPMLLLGAGLPSTPSFLHDVRTYTERWRYFEIGLLSPEQTADAIVRPLSDRSINIEAAARDALVDASGGYPFFIQEYASAAWTTRKLQDRIDLADVQASIPGVTKALEASLYDQRFRNLTPREVRYVLALHGLGVGIHSTGDIAAALGATSADVSSIRSQLVKKEVLFSPSPGIVEFRIPLTDRYVTAHHAQLEKRAALAIDGPRLDRASGKSFKL